MSEDDNTGDSITFDGREIVFPIRVSFWRRLWFLVTAIPRYLISGSVEVP